MNQPKRALIVDDEPLARQALKIALAEFEQIEIVGECANGFEAVTTVKTVKPDIIFLDIQMPKLDGFDVVELLGEDAPFIVFVTAHDEFAIKAFETHALDYLLKPVKPERLAKTLKQLEKRRPSKADESLKEIIRSHHKRLAPLSRLLVHEKANVIIIPVEEITHIKAQDDYVCIYTTRTSYLKHERLSRLEEMVDSSCFHRIHRSYLLNINYLSKIEPTSKDSRAAILKNGEMLPISRSGYSRLIEYL